jgi:hypothetical protein
VLASGLPVMVNLIAIILQSFHVLYAKLPITPVYDNLVARDSMMLNFASPGIL